jgi:uncharacterized tellurite resistance protein B-like protein
MHEAMHHQAKHITFHPGDRMGLKLHASKGNMLVREVIQGGAADLKGIFVGDAVLEINGVTLAELGLSNDYDGVKKHLKERVQSGADFTITLCDAANFPVAHAAPPSGYGPGAPGMAPPSGSTPDGRAQYKELVQMAAVDGQVHAHERERLQEAQSRYNISEQDHMAIVAEVFQSGNKFTIESPQKRRGGGGGGGGLNCQNGGVRKGDRVYTVYDVNEGGDGRPYHGTLDENFANGDVKIRYDDGEIWTVPANKSNHMADCFLENPGASESPPQPVPLPEQEAFNELQRGYGGEYYGGGVGDQSYSTPGPDGYGNGDERLGFTRDGQMYDPYNMRVGPLVGDVAMDPVAFRAHPPRTPAPGWPTSGIDSYVEGKLTSFGFESKQIKEQWASPDKQIALEASVDNASSAGWKVRTSIRTSAAQRVATSETTRMREERKMFESTTKNGDFTSVRRSNGYQGSRGKGPGTNEPGRSARADVSSANLPAYMPNSPNHTSQIMNIKWRAPKDWAPIDRSGNDEAVGYAPDPEAQNAFLALQRQTKYQKEIDQYKATRFLQYRDEYGVHRVGNFTDQNGAVRGKNVREWREVLNKKYPRDAENSEVKRWRECRFSGGPTGLKFGPKLNQYGENASERDGERLADYRRMVEMANADGEIDHHERKRLAKDRLKYGVSLVEHNRICDEVVNGHRSGPEQIFVSEVAPGSEADRFGITPGDVILGLDNMTLEHFRIRNAAELEQKLKQEFTAGRRSSGRDNRHSGGAYNGYDSYYGGGGMSRPFTINVAVPPDDPLYCAQLQRIHCERYNTFNDSSGGVNGNVDNLILREMLATSPGMNKHRRGPGIIPGGVIANRSEMEISRMDPGRPISNGITHYEDRQLVAPNQLLPSPGPVPVNGTAGAIPYNGGNYDSSPGQLDWTPRGTRSPEQA